MKKVIILTAAAMAFGFVNPQVSNAMKLQNKIAVVDDKDDKYKEIKAEELPESVTKSISNAYTGYKIDKAYKDEDGDSYKVKVAMGDLRYSLFYDEKGELIKVEEPTAERVDDAMDKTGKDIDKAVDKSEKKTSEAWEKTEKKTNDTWDKTDKKMNDAMNKSSVDTTKTYKNKTSNVDPSNKNNSTFPSNTQTK